MNNLSKCLGRLLEEAGRQVAHESSIAQLEQAFREVTESIRLPLSKELAADLMEVELKCYDASFRLLDLHLAGHNKFVLEFVLRLRLVGIDALLLTMRNISSQETRGIITKELVERLVVTSRMALNNGPAYAGRVKAINQFVDEIQETVGELSARVAYLHLLNSCEYARYECQTAHYDPNTLADRLEALKKVNFSGSSPKDMRLKTEYQPLINSFLMEICTKLLKKNVDARCLLKYLPEEYKLPLQALYATEQVVAASTSFPGVSSVFYPLYFEVREHGLERVDLKVLREILSKNWDEPGFFEIIYVRIRQCINVLTLWFEVFIDKGFSLHQTEAYKLFVAVANNFMSTGEHPSSILTLTLTVCRSFSATKKKTSNQSLFPLKKCIMVLIELISQQHSDEIQMLELFNELTSVVKRIKFFDHHRDLQKMMCFYLLVRNSPHAESYYKDYINSAKSKTEADTVVLLYRCIKSSGAERASSLNELVRSKSSAVPILLLSQPETILELSEDWLTSFKQPMSYYCMLFSKELPDEKLQKALKHFRYSLERLDIRQNVKYLKGIQQLLLQRLKQSQLSNEVQYCAVLSCLYCEVASLLGERLPNNNLSPNQFYRFNIWLDLCMSQPTVSHEFIILGSIFLLKSLQKYLLERETKGRANLAVGEFDCLSKLFEILMKHHSESNQQKNAIKFAMVQIMLVSDSVSVGGLKRIVADENSKQQLQLYNTIEFMPEEIRAAVLRKLVLISIESNERAELNPDDLKKLILMTNDKKERMIYIKELLLTGDAECQTFVEILASMYPEVAEELIEPADLA